MSNPPSNQWLFGARLAKLARTQKRLVLKLHGIGVEANKENAAQWQKLTSPGLLESEKIRSTRFKPMNECEGGDLTLLFKKAVAH